VISYGNKQELFIAAGLCNLLKCKISIHAYTLTDTRYFLP